MSLARASCWRHPPASSASHRDIPAFLPWFFQVPLSAFRSWLPIFHAPDFLAHLRVRARYRVHPTCTHHTIFFKKKKPAGVFPAVFYFFSASTIVVPYVRQRGRTSCVLWCGDHA